MIHFFSFIGYSGSGKTASIESLVNFISKTYPNKKLIVLKHIHIENFTIDTPGKDTFKYSQAGAHLVVAQSQNESSFIFNNAMEPREILQILIPIYQNSEEDVIVIFESFRNVESKTIEKFTNINLIKILCVASCQIIEDQLKYHPDYIAGSIFSETNIKELENAKQNYPDIKFINVLNAPECLIQNIFYKLE